MENTDVSYWYGNRRQLSMSSNWKLGNRSDDIRN